MADRVVYCQRPAGALLERGDTNGEALHVDPLQIVLAGDGLGQRRCPAALTLPIQNRPSSRIEAVSESRESGPKACSSRVRVEENSAESLLRKKARFAPHVPPRDAPLRGFGGVPAVQFDEPVGEPRGAAAEYPSDTVSSLACEGPTATWSVEAQSRVMGDVLSGSFCMARQEECGVAGAPADRGDSAQPPAARRPFCAVPGLAV